MLFSPAARRTGRASESNQVSRPGDIGDVKAGTRRMQRFDRAGITYQTTPFGPSGMPTPGLFRPPGTLETSPYMRTGK